MKICKNDGRRPYAPRGASHTPGADGVWNMSLAGQLPADFASSIMMEWVVAEIRTSTNGVVNPDLNPDPIRIGWGVNCNLCMVGKKNDFALNYGIVEVFML